MKKCAYTNSKDDSNLNKMHDINKQIYNPPPPPPPPPRKTNPQLNEYMNKQKTINNSSNNYKTKKTNDG